MQEREEVSAVDQGGSSDNKTQSTQIVKSLVFYGYLFRHVILGTRLHDGGGVCSQVRVHGDRGGGGVNLFLREDVELNHDVCGRDPFDGDDQHANGRGYGRHANGRGDGRHANSRGYGRHANVRGDGYHHELVRQTRSIEQVLRSSISFYKIFN